MVSEIPLARTARDRQAFARRYSCAGAPLVRAPKAAVVPLAGSRMPISSIFRRKPDMLIGSPRTASYAACSSRMENVPTEEGGQRRVAALAAYAFDGGLDDLGVVKRQASKDAIAGGDQADAWRLRRGQFRGRE